MALGWANCFGTKMTLWTALGTNFLESSKKKKKRARELEKKKRENESWNVFERGRKRK